MKNIPLLLLFVLLVATTSCVAQKKQLKKSNSITLSYENPLWQGYLADPYMFKASNGYYYAIGTGLKDDHADNKGNLDYKYHFPLIKSKDMQNWELVDGVLPALTNPDIKRYWAPEIVENNGKYYLFYSGDFRIRVAVADKPEGPYTDSGKQLLTDIGFNIDGHPYHDPVTKQWYLFIARKFKFGEKVGTGLAVVKLNNDMTSIEGEVHPITTEFRDWNLFNPKQGDFCVEGPSVIYKDGKYWCFYSGGNWQTPTYGVGCLVADSIMGTYIDPWSIDRGSVVCTIPDKLIGPGHTSIILAPDNITYFLIYHSWNQERTKRQICTDPIEWREQGPKLVNPARGKKSFTIPLN